MEFLGLLKYYGKPLHSEFILEWDYTCPKCKHEMAYSHYCQAKGCKRCGFSLERDLPKLLENV